MYINATKVIADGAFHSIDLNSIEINNDLYVAANGHFVNRKETLKFDFETYNFITIGKNFKINQDLMVGGLFGYYRLTDDEKIGHNGKILLVGELLKP
ncbi:hypothetical protein FACS1894152_3670 [Bacilli bacterium]|nr:hypothetical protein FACS1894152_3670 [Bacilli bacterium]